MLYKMIGEIQNQIGKLIETLESGIDCVSEYVKNMGQLDMQLTKCSMCLPEQMRCDYLDFFQSYHALCEYSQKEEYFCSNIDMITSTITLLEECMRQIESDCKAKIHKCICCGKYVEYVPLSPYFDEMGKRYHSYTAVDETLNRESYTCPNCGSSDRDRMIVSFLKKIKLQKATNHPRVLQIAPAPSIHNWIVLNCPNVEYETTDLFMDEVTYKSDVQDMHNVERERYDIIICSHVLEHVQDDRKALKELYRILKEDGIIAFLVPVDLSIEEIDEEWGCSEEENWRRFGQGDHCRRYSKTGLVERLKEEFYVHQMGKEYFGESVFCECGLLDRSVLYVLTKKEEISLNMLVRSKEDQKLMEEGPLVTVIMSCYNHGAYVADAIESVRKQSYKNIEFLVADDGSSDNSVEVMKRYDDCYSQAFYHEDNIGGRQYELSDIATGKYLALMNSDDVWDEDKIFLQVKHLEEHPEVGFCFTWCQYVDEFLNLIDDHTFFVENKTQEQWVRFFWEHGNALCNPSTVARLEYRQEIQKVGRDCWQLPDFFNWICLAQETQFYVMPQPLTMMRRYDNSWATNVSAEKPENTLRSVIELGTHWMWSIREMEKSFFKAAFGDLFIDKGADSEDEIKCEKYFLLLNNKNPLIQHSAFVYLAGEYRNIYNCLLNKYGYTVLDISRDYLAKGIATAI